VTSAVDVLVVGSLNRDYVCRVAELPAAGQTVLGAEASVGSGGKGGNQAVAASLLGARTAMVARVGGDDDGRALVADLARVGVDTRHVDVASARTGLAFVMVDAHGENSIVVAPGANDALDADAVAQVVRELLSPPAVVVTQAEIPAAAFEAAIRTASELGCRAVVNLSPYRPLPEDALALCHPLVVNESEASELLGRPVRGADQARLAVAELVQRTLSVVVTVGAEGAVAGEGAVIDHVAAEPAEVVDTTGAGDAFTGALAAALSGDRPLAEATRIGVAAGTHVVRRLGAQASFSALSGLRLPPLHGRS
jgi:ribokinase